MKKPFVLIAAIVAVVPLGAAAAVAKETIKDETIKVGTSVTLKFNVGSGDVPPGEGVRSGSFSGTVKAKKGCQKEREVTLREKSYGTKQGSDWSNNRGRYTIFFEDRPAHRFFAVVEEKTTKKKGETIVCESAKSKPVNPDDKGGP